MDGRLNLLACICICLPFASSQVYPAGFSILVSAMASVNGSSQTCTGHFRTVTTYRCPNPRTSVLFGTIPTLTGLDGDQWANQLFTLKGPSAEITFHFTDVSDYTGVEKIEVVMFNCPQWRIGLDTISILESSTFFGSRRQVGSITSTATASCDSLVRVCTNLTNSSQFITLRFTDFNWVHLAEVIFYSDVGSSYPTDAILTPLLPTGTMATTGRVTSTSSTQLTDSNMSSSSESSTESSMTLIIVVIIFLLVVIFAIIFIVIVILLLLRRRTQKRKGGYNNTVSMQVIVSKANNDTNLSGKLEKTPEYDVDNKDQLYSTPSKDMSRNLYDVVSSKNPKSEESVPSDAGVCDDGPCYTSIGIDGNPDIYNTLSHGHAVENVNSNSTYSKLGYATGGSYFSIPNTNLNKTSCTSPSHIYSSVTRPDERPAKPKCTHDLLSYETGEEVPRYPEKSLELQQNLDMKLLDEAPHDTENAVDVGNDIYSLPTSSANKMSSLTRPAINTGSLSNNPLYFSIESELGSYVTENTITDNVYAEPDLSIAAETCMFPSLENIYESIYSEALQPSHFMQGPEDIENINDLCPYSSIYTVPVIATTQEEALEVTMENIQEEVILGSGNFGSVILAHTVGLSHYDLKIGKSTDKTISVPVAVKKLKDGAGESAKEQFEKEYRFMFRLNHPNVIRLLGICMTETSFIMMEYMENGDLNQVLQHQYYTIVDGGTIPGEGEITQQMLIHICTQIASAMDYLASNNFVHRDLATRNCLVGENFHVKISDFGMSRSLYESHYYILRGRAILPIRWMATECFYGKFSAKSDVWAFGITMWEIFMLSKEEPYYEMSDKDLVQNAICGAERLLLSCPEGCPHKVYEVINCCWAHEASQRATFEQLHEKLISLE